MNDFSIYYNKSVLNALDDDFQRFNELKVNAKKLLVICEDGEKFVNGFNQIIGDIWFSFYSQDVQFISEIKNLCPYHSDFIQHLLTLDDYKKWHMYTQCDDLLSVLTTITIGEQLLSFIKQDDQIKMSSYKRKIAERKKQFAENKLEEMTSNIYSDVELPNGKFQFIVNEKMLALAVAEIEEANVIGLQKIVAFKDHLLNSIHAHTQLNHIHRAMSSLFNMTGRKMQHVSLKEQLKLADTITKNKLLYEIAELLGRFHKIVNKKMKTTQHQTIARKDVAIGNELSRLLPIEYANYILPASKIDFLKRYAESLTITYDPKGKERWGRGPIIICIDESSSMHSMKAESKAFCFAFIKIALKQKRDLVIIPFSSNIGEVQYFKKGQVITDHIITFSEKFLGGGTNFEQPLRHALSILNKRHFKAADILFVTDGSSALSNSFIEEFNEVKKQRKFECISIILPNGYNSVDLSVVQKFSTKVIEVNNLFEAEEVFLL